MNEINVGRQQILDNNKNIFAYELLFRGVDYDLSQQQGATHATNQVITDTILEIGLNEIVGTSKAFINFTAQNLLEKTPLNLPKDRIVIEVLEDVTVDLRIIAVLKELSQQGYMIALDDFVLSPQWKPLLKFADIVKLDIMAMPLSESLQLIEKLKPFNLTLLAEKVETHEEYEALKAAGCELFQGFFFSKPNLVSGKRVGINQTSAIELLTSINKNEPSFAEISQVISTDVGLSYKLLHYINSAFFSLPNKIESIPLAITYLGLAEIKRWVNILTLASLADDSDVLIQQALMRGKMCELLALQQGQNAENMFMLGMLSLLDSLLGTPLNEAIEQLPLSEEIISALLEHKGVSGELLAFVMAYERWELNGDELQKAGDLKTIYLQSIEWTNKVLGNIN